jgi:hypothetical protein
MKMKPLPKMVFVITLMGLMIIGLKAGIDHGLIPTPGMLGAVTNANGVVTWTPNDITVQRDSDWEMSQHILQANGYSTGEDALIGDRYQPGETTGYPALDNALRYVWHNAGVLLLVFTMLAFLTSGLLSREAESHNDQMRREAEELESPGLSEDIHEPFNAPEGMQPASQYVPIRTKH